MHGRRPAKIAGVTAAEAQSRLDVALSHHRAGRLDAAEATYRDILAAHPNSADALHLLGVIEFSRGRYPAALSLLQRALAIRPAAEVYGNLGPVLAAMGRPDESLTAYRQALALRPVYPEAHNNIAKLLYARREFDEAIAEFRTAAAQAPQQADIWNNLGLVLKEQGRNAEAIETYRLAIAARPDFADAHNNLGIALQAAGGTDEAIAACATAVRLDPESGECLNSLGNALQARGRLDEAVAAYRRALVLRPDLVETHNNLGNALRTLGRIAEAITAYRAALALRPMAAEVLSNLGNTLQAAGELDEAIASFEQALTLRPTLNYAISNIGNALKDRGELDAALEHFQRATDQEPAASIAFSNHLFTRAYHPRQTAGDILQAAREYDARYALPLRPPNATFDNDRTAGRPLRVGYVSPNFKDHCQALFLSPLFQHHDPAAITVFCYSDVTRPDAVTEHLRQWIPHWRHTVGVTDERLAAQIRADGIDILVDLTLHMSSHRLLTFARRPAPVQITWLGYPGTTGVSAIDYRFSDPQLDPPDLMLPYVEQTLRLPETFWCYDSLTTEPTVNDLPAQRNGFVTFGCFNNFCKINDDVLTLWAEVMRAVAGSRLMLLAPKGIARDRLLGMMHDQQISADRIQFVGFEPRLTYMKQYHLIDLGLDSFPYNGHTTSLDSLWMGVPVMTLVGPTVVGRAGLSQLSNLQLADHFAATSSAQFVEMAIRWSNDLPVLAELRRSLRRRMETSPLMDAARFTRGIEALYRHAWTTWCDDASAGRKSERTHR